ncbi:MULTISPECIES: carbohydrate ABC transporter permease [Bacillus]|uniref:Multiple sugar transport system permease protein n=2 Tax=Bacillus velezensis TaxID=492670 RepID=I2C9V0_BACAY|nr:multiple sugar transport system permease protein [Bacillus velezensis YAU B9601-Y2]AIU83127.1 L-arabinose transport system permease protein AraP [Bacillus velezensis]AJK66661.1 putative ABC transporter permease [Bacillus amyloliquefaciens KHG19]MCW5195346.1 L-arabinose transport system permease protein AraP [Bacillus amyloliquefaciens]CCP22894.1 fructose-amino acid permease [Bacillus velezensis UCMB5036]CDH96922.1 sn-glycerol-3-phosphate transport system permease protein ugpA [Bacillus vele
MRISLVSRKRFIPYLFLAPALIFLLFVYIPIIENVFFSLFEWSSFQPEKTFIGLKNYIDLFHDPVFFTALRNNVLYAVISLICQVGGGLILAAVLEDRLVRKWSPFFRTVFFLPVVISMTVIALLFDFIYNPEIGLLNQLLEAVGLDELTRAWLGDENTAMLSVIFVSQWQSVGYIAMLYIVSIQSIPAELYESAQLDGAGKIQQFFHITVPQTKEMSFVAVVMTLTGAFTVFNEPYILTGGGPGNASEVLSTFLYKSAFTKDMMGYASAIATVVLLLTLALSLIQMKFFKTGKEE